MVPLFVYLYYAKGAEIFKLGIPDLITVAFINYFFLPKSLFPYTTYEIFEIYYFMAFPYIYVHYHYRVVGSISGRYDVVFKDIIPLSNPKSFSRVLVLGTFVGLGIYHYYYDKLAFRFSDPEIKKVLQKYL